MFRPQRGGVSPALSNESRDHVTHGPNSVRHVEAATSLNAPIFGRREGCIRQTFQCPRLHVLVAKCFTFAGTAFPCTPLHVKVKVCGIVCLHLAAGLTLDDVAVLRLTPTCARSGP